MELVIGFRWVSPATATNVAQTQSRVFVRSPQFTPVESLVIPMEREVEVFTPTFAKFAKVFARGQDRHTVSIVFWRRYADPMVASWDKAAFLKQMPASNLPVDLGFNWSSTGFRGSAAFLAGAIKSLRAVEQVGCVVKWEMTYLGGELKYPSPFTLSNGTGWPPFNS
jgi:hypothetical protein